MSRKSSVFNNQKLFSPSVVRRYTNSNGVLREQTLNSMSGSDVADSSLTGSFRFDPPGSPLKSTQQLPVDFSKFENHTFFSSAKTNVNLAFEKIINKFPFDGSKNEYDIWLDDLTGYEKWVLDNYPQHTGYLTFHGNDEYIDVVDKSGVIFPSISRKVAGQTILNPKSNSFFLEMDLSIPDEASGDQFVAYHMSDFGVGYAAFLQSTSSTSVAKLNFLVKSGSSYLTASADIDKGAFSHLSCYYDTSLNSKRLYIKSGSTIIAESNRLNFGQINTGGNNLLIGSGSEIAYGASIFTPSQTFSGSINNFRIFHNIRKDAEIERFTKRTLFSDKSSDLKINFRFNEPTGSYQNNDVILDHSGNSLHTRVLNYTEDIRSELPYTSLCEFEDSIYHPVLFPGNEGVLSMNETLLSLASQYDENNPNLITKLIPEHYLEVAKYDNGNSIDVDGTLYEGIEATSDQYSVPGAARIGQPQIISALLFMWGRMFDELKMMIDHVSELIHIDYDSNASVADQLIPFLAEYYGFNLSSMFRNASYEQFFEGENVVEEKTTNLQFLQNEIWRRILVNLPEIVRSKGTLHSIKSLFRASGIEPDRLFRFVEYGGNNRLRLGKSRQKITEISTMLDFSGSAGGAVSAQGFYSDNPNLLSSYLTGSRTEVGYPPPAGNFIDTSTFSPHGISDNENDGLLTSGSWTTECHFKFPLNRSFTSPQSIIRMHTTSSIYDYHNVIVNIVADPNIDEDVDNPILTFFARPGLGSSDPVLSMSITNANIFDGNKWYLSFGRKRNDSIQSYSSSSYFLNLMRQENGELIESYSSSSYFLESIDPQDNILQSKTALVLGSSEVLNASGSFLVVGSQQLSTAAPGLSNSTVNSLARATEMKGMISHIRFWSKALTTNEVKEHALNFSSLGVEDPTTNFGFTNHVTGSFEKLRLDISTDQPIQTTDSSGFLELVDFSQNFYSTNSSYLRGFEQLKQIIKPERFDFSTISYLFDEPNDPDKVRIVGMTEGENIEKYDALPGPIYEIPAAKEPMDDVRFSIEFSASRALNEDIMKIFATLESLDDILGSPNALFSDEYYKLRNLREVYFNRLIGNVNYSSFFEFFRWLDESFDIMIENLIPKKTNYMGFNMIIESHVLERARVAYGYGDMYLGESNRKNLKGVILLRQLLANIRKI